MQHAHKMTEHNSHEAGIRSKAAQGASHHHNYSTVHVTVLSGAVPCCAALCRLCSAASWGCQQGVLS
jgi:hypothetical protein